MGDSEYPLTEPESSNFLPVPGFGGYEVSDLGEVRNSKTLRVLSQDRSGRYPKVSLHSKTVKVHHLVLAAFRGPRPDGCEARHLNDVPYDNRLENLVWGTRAENVLDGVKNRNKSKPVSRPGGIRWKAFVTHCPKGHEYTVENTYLYRDSRYCRNCKSERQSRQRVLV